MTPTYRRASDGGDKRRERARRSFSEEAITSRKEYEETGLHLTGEEVRRWLAGWGTDAECTTPSCHM